MRRIFFALIVILLIMGHVVMIARFRSIEIKARNSYKYLCALICELCKDDYNTERCPCAMVGGHGACPCDFPASEFMDCGKLPAH